MRIFRDGTLVLFCDSCWQPQSGEVAAATVSHAVPVVDVDGSPGSADARYEAHVCRSCLLEPQRPRAVPVRSKRAPEPRRLIQDGIVYGE